MSSAQSDSEHRTEYEIYVCDVCGQDADQADYPICPNCQSDRNLELVKVVRADTYEGAVEAIRAAFQVLSDERRDFEAANGAHAVLGAWLRSAFDQKERP